VIAGMREGLPLYYLPDQDYGPRETLFVPFFGIQTATVPALSRIARIVGAKVLPCVTRMLSPGEGYLVTIEARGRISRLPIRRRYPAHERIHRAQGAGDARAIPLDAQAVQDAPAGRAALLSED
jgi:hypothetical protein